MVAHGGNTQPPLFKSAMTSSTYLSSQYEYNHPILEVCSIASIKVKSSFIPSTESILGRSPNGRVGLDPQPSLRNYSMPWGEIRCTNASDTFQCLVGTDQATLQKANVATSVLGFYAAIVSSPCIDGDFIQNSPTQQISSGKLNGVSILGSGSFPMPEKFYRNVSLLSQTRSKGRDS